MAPTTRTKLQGTPSDRQFRRTERLRTSTEIARVFARKRTATDGALVVHLSDNGLEWSRLGIITPKRIGNAVHRNAVRRRIREAFRTNKDTLPQGFDILCVARRGANEVAGNLTKSFLMLCARAVRKAERKPHR